MDFYVAGLQQAVSPVKFVQEKIYMFIVGLLDPGKDDNFSNKS